MSFKRDLDVDRAATRAVLAGQRRACDGSVDRGREVNWLGHEVTSGAAKIDEMLISGATKAQMEKARNGVGTHLTHLREDHGLPIIPVNGKFRFDRAALGVASEVAELGAAAEVNDRAPRPASPADSRATPTNTRDAQARLVAVVARIAEEKRADLEKHKEGYADIARPDFLWHYLLQSFATMGRSSGWHGLIGDKANYNRVTYAAIEALPASERLQVVCETCRAAKVRMPDRKGDYILGCFERVHRLGGPEAAKAELLAQPGRDAKIAWLKSMPGIGDKYARNVMMDVYHEDFRDSIAVDARIKAVSESLGLSFASYSAHEQFYLDVAHQAGLNGWELDRLLYNFLDQVLSRL